MKLLTLQSAPVTLQYIDWPIRPILGFWGVSWGAKFPKMGDSLPRTPMNRRAKFDAASFILGGEIRNVQTQNYNKYFRLRGRPYIHTCRGRAWACPARSPSVEGAAASSCNTCRTPIHAPNNRFCGVWPLNREESSSKMGDSLPRTPMNQRAKFDAASFIVAGEIRNRTNENTKKNKQ